MTPQYEALEELYRRYNKDGLEILDFPCNQFKGQAPGTDEEIYKFLQEHYQTTFKTFSKIEVNGEGEIPLYTWLKDKGKGSKGEIEWNFTKFLVDRSGENITRYEPPVTPEEIEEDIVKLLKEGK